VSTTNDGSRPSGDDRTHGILAFYRLSRSLRNTELPRDLTWERLSTLSVIAQRQPVSISELSVAEEVTAPTISRTISALQQRDLVRCVANRQDGRSVLVTCTAKGRAALEKGMARTLQQVAEMLARFEPTALEAMADMIRQIRDSKN
jgi:DNA-binding MarR family transcriptional regulator